MTDNDKSIMLSIIVPVYNSDRTLDRCIESIISQSYCNFELILINDGSSDGSSVILSDFDKKDERIVVVNQQNMGVSAARNNGIKVARGELVVFIDSDDTIEPGYLQALAEDCHSNNADVIFTGYNLVTKNGLNKINNPGIGQINYIKSFELDIENLINNKLFLSSWSKAYCLKIIKDNELYFDVNLKNGEDLVFNMDYFLHVNKYSSIDDCYYNYFLDNNESLSRKTDNYRIENNANLMDRSMVFCKKMGIFDGGIGIFAKYYLKSQIYTIDLILESSSFTKKQKINAISYFVSLEQTNIACSEKITSKFDLEWTMYVAIVSIKSKKLVIMLSGLRRFMKGLMR